MGLAYVLALLVRQPGALVTRNDVQGGYFYFTATESTGHIWLLQR